VGIRQTLNENPVITTAVTGVIVLTAVVFIFKQACSLPGGSLERADPTTKFYFTIDDGKSYFADDARKVPPFDYQGKPAVRVLVFRCPDGNEHVSHLERYAPADKKRLEDALAKEPTRHIGQLEATAFIGVKEVKKPGVKDWVKMSAKTVEEYSTIQRPKCPDGATTGLQWVLPE
jgi:hypothetical protein